MRTDVTHNRSEVGPAAPWLREEANRQWNPHSSKCVPKKGLNNGVFSVEEREKSESTGIHWKFGAGAGHRAFILCSQWLILSKIRSSWQGQGEAKSLGKPVTHSGNLWFHIACVLKTVTDLKKNKKTCSSESVFNAKKKEKHDMIWTWSGAHWISVSHSVFIPGGYTERKKDENTLNFSGQAVGHHYCIENHIRRVKTVTQFWDYSWTQVWCFLKLFQASTEQRRPEPGEYI